LRGLPANLRKLGRRNARVGDEDRRRKGDQPGFWKRQRENVHGLEALTGRIAARYVYLERDVEGEDRRRALAGKAYQFRHLWRRKRIYRFPCAGTERQFSPVRHRGPTRVQSGFYHSRAASGGHVL